MTETEPTLADLAAFACELADLARAETMRARPFAVEDKAEGGEFDPVTEADRAAERAVRDRISRRFPDHGISGEEFADVEAGSPYSWSIDPIDGTRAFICDLPSWTTLIALLENGLPVIGVVDAPRLGERYLGQSGETLLLAQERVSLRTSGCTRLAEARLSTTDPFLFDGAEAAGFERVRRAVRTSRYSLDAYAYARLAAGSIDLVVETALKPHDYNALIPVVRGAGGTVGDWDGGNDFSQGRVIAAATPSLYDQAVALLAG